MGDLSKILGDNGPGWEVTALGQLWTLGGATQRVKAKFENWLERTARERLDLQYEIDLEEAEDDESKKEARERYAKELEAFRDRRDAGAYGWQKDVFRMAMRRGDGIERLLFYLLQKHHPTVTLDDVKRIGEDDSAVVRIGEIMSEIVDDAPNSSKPEKTPANSEEIGTSARP